MSIEEGKQVVNIGFWMFREITTSLQMHLPTRCGGRQSQEDVQSTTVPFEGTAFEDTTKVGKSAEDAVKAGHGSEM